MNQRFIVYAVVLLIVFAADYYGYLGGGNSAPSQPTTAQTGRDIFADAFASKAEDLQVRGEGVVSRVLADDNKGSRHQRFLIELPSGQSLLVAHNIDLAPRVENLRRGDRVSFNGVYEWNPRGGVIHWTHHDPAGRHEEGWIEHNGRTYK